MNNVVSMVNYYLLHKNADDSVIEYIKNKLDKSSIEDLIIIQIELLYTDPSDKLVSNLVNYINLKINDVLKDIELSSLVLLISSLEDKQNDIKNEINKKQEEIDSNFKKIQTKDLNNDNIFDDKDVITRSAVLRNVSDKKIIIDAFDQCGFKDLKLISTKQILSKNKTFIEINEKYLILYNENKYFLFNVNKYFSIENIINKILKSISKNIYLIGINEKITELVEMNKKLFYFENSSIFYLKNAKK